MKKRNPYQKTLRACYLAFITQAIAGNFTALLFLRFRSEFNITLGRIALIPTIYFMTQLVVDLLSVVVVDRIGYRRVIVSSQAFCALGLASLAFLPYRFADPFVGILISVFLYALGSGLIEVLCSPIVEACPFENKERVMSLLHSFYCWGSVGVVLLSTLFFAVFGVAHWRILSCLWALVPLYNITNFAVCPIERLVEEGKGMSVAELFRMPLFWVAVLLMACAGASELSMSQWASAFAESTLSLTKTVGDLAGPCMFAMMEGVCRLIYGKYGHKLELSSFMIGSGVLCLICYLLAGVSTLPILGLIGCIVCGFSVGIMWPGTLSISARSMPRGGTAMFALLAMAGALGGAVGPGLVGVISQQNGDNLQTGLLVSCIFPVLLIVGLLLMKRLSPKNYEGGKP